MRNHEKNNHFRFTDKKSFFSAKDSFGPKKSRDASGKNEKP